MDEEEFKRRRGRVYAAVTPRELWKASGHRAGSRERADKADLWRARSGSSSPSWASPSSS
jgi:hypothetical protein